MSQRVRILGIKVTGQVFLGTDADGADMWSADPSRVAGWMADGWRARFNQHRSKRRKYVYGFGDQAGADEKGRVLVPIGSKVTDISDREAREQFSYLRALPMQVLQSPERIESTEWFAAAKRRKTNKGKGHPAGRMPRFQSRKKHDHRFVCWFNGGRNATYQQTGRRTGILTIRGQNPALAPDGTGKWQLRFRVRHTQQVREYTSVAVNLTRREVVFVSPAPEREHTPTGAVVGLDVGVTNTIATDTGEMYDLPDLKPYAKEVARHQRRMAKSRKIAESQGREFRTSSRYQAHKTAAAAAYAKAARIREDWAHKMSAAIVDSHDIVAFENLQIRNMTRSAKGTIEKPGRNVKQKAGLNRAMLNAGLGRLRSFIEYKGANAGIAVVPVPPAYTSQRCRACKEPARENRDRQAFSCVFCGHTDNADTNAAGNILDAALEILSQSTGGGPGKGRAGSGIKTVQAQAWTAPAMNREPLPPRRKTHAVQRGSGNPRP